MALLERRAPDGPDGGTMLTERNAIINIVQAALRGFGRRPAALYREWRVDLEEAGRQLAAMAASSEGEFLRLGARLQEIHQQAKEISQLSVTATERLSGDTVVSEIEGLKNVLGKVADQSDVSQRGSFTISSLIAQLQAVRQLLENFGRITGNLRVLCNLIKIESAHLGNRHDGFLSLGEAVQSIISQVESASATLLKKTNDTIQLMNDHLAFAEKFEKNQQEKAMLISERLNQSMAEMKNRYEISCGIVRDAAIHWNQISKSVGEVVASLQFHDITRQRIEHVRDYLAEISDLLQKNTGNNKLISSGEGFQLQNGGPATPGKAAESGRMSMAIATCDLQIAQLQHAGHDLTEAVNRIGENLRQIAAIISAMSVDIRKATGAAGENERTYFSELEDTLFKLRDTIGEFTDMNRKMSAATLQVAVDMTEMRGLIRDIEKVGIAMRVTALNACVHAAHLGEDGLAMGVLADSIHKLAAHTSGNIEAISNHLTAIVRETESLSRQDGRYDQTRLDKEGESLLLDVETLMKPLQQMDLELAGLLQRIGCDGAELQREIQGLADGLPAQEEMSEGMERVRDFLKALVGRMRVSLPRGQGDGQAMMPGDLSRYTMDREREIHLAVTASPLVALPVAAGKEEEIEVRDGTDDMGDNVELF